jgi:hypothetical protein
MAESAASALRSADPRGGAVECPLDLRPARIRHDGARNAHQAFPVALEQALFELCPLFDAAALRAWEWAGRRSLPGSPPATAT